jgi:DNA (cytosine-5)-methyltransferase 1
MKALDMFCGAGGATKGLQLAGFHVTGIDHKPQPRYCGDAFIQSDATNPPVNLSAFDFIWASPPCQAFTPLRKLQRGKEYVNLIPQTRALLVGTGVPYVIENVEGAPLGESGYLIMLCGTMFALRNDKAELWRHRLFETSFSIPLRPQCQHGHRECLSVHGTGGRSSNRERHATRRLRAMTITGHTPQTNVVRNQVRETFSTDDARAVMGIDWMGMKGLSQAIPPAYSQFIARQFLESTEARNGE